MECLHCHTQNPEGSTFCSGCGKPMNTQTSLASEANTEQAQPVPELSSEEHPAAVVSERCPNCGEAIDAETVYCENCGLNVRPVADETYSEPKPKKGNIKKVLLIIGITIASLLLIFVIAGLCTNWFGLNGPITQIGSAAANTFSKKNLSVDFEIQVDDEIVDGTLLFDMDVKEEVIQMYLEMNNEDSKYIIAIYDDQLIYGEEDDLSSRDISYFISTICDTIEEGKDSTISFNKAWDQIIDMIPNKKQEEINDDYVNLKTLKKLVKSFFVGKLNNAKWLKDNAGYSTSRQDGMKIYAFEPDAYEFLYASAEHFESAFVKASVYNDFIDAIEDSEEITEQLDIYVGFGVKNRKLVLIEAEVIYDDFPVELTFEFYDIGKTEIDEDLLDDLLDEAEMNN